MTVKAAGLPDISGYLIYQQDNFATTVYGVFTTSGSAQNIHHNGLSSGTIPNHLNFRASNSDAIYGNSNTVQPPALSLIPQIKY